MTFCVKNGFISGRRDFDTRAEAVFLKSTMPIYEYEVILPDAQGGDRFEILQSMQDAALTTHPLTGEPVRRVLQVPNLSTRYTPGSTAKKLENGKLEKAGFTKYERDKLTGKYHRTAGKEGPATIDRPPA